MNARQLQKLGVPYDSVPVAIGAVQSAVATGNYRGAKLKQTLRQVVDAPSDFVADPLFGELAQSLLADPPQESSQPVDYQTWGEDIDPAAHAQMRQACGVPGAVQAALMPDAHVGYGLPIGGVLATENIVIPYAVGVDIACRMKLSVLDMPPESLKQKGSAFESAIEKGTRFGIGSAHQRP